MLLFGTELRNDLEILWDVKFKCSIMELDM